MSGSRGQGLLSLFTAELVALEQCLAHRRFPVVPGWIDGKMEWREGMDGWRDGWQAGKQVDGWEGERIEDE